jgi:hypothetical protein
MRNRVRIKLYQVHALVPYSKRNGRAGRPQPICPQTQLWVTVRAKPAHELKGEPVITKGRWHQLSTELPTHHG